MLILNAADIRALAPMPRMIEALRTAFCTDYIVPPRQVAKMRDFGEERLFVSMPAFDPNGGSAVKLATLFADNLAKGLPTVQATIVVFSNSGTPMAVLDGTLVTQLRTGAASALASAYLSRKDSSRLVIMGTGALAPAMAAAHSAIRPITQIRVWGRRRERAQQTCIAVRGLVPGHIDVDICESIEADVAEADIVSCASGADVPILAGRWLQPGTFVDLVGSFSPAKREADDEVMSRSRIFVDTFEGTLTEAGDIIQPLSRGIIERSRIEGELADLARGRVEGRRRGEEIIAFKSVGTAIEDLAAAQLIVAEALQRARR